MGLWANHVLVIGNAPWMAGVASSAIFVFAKTHRPSNCTASCFWANGISALERLFNCELTHNLSKLNEILQFYSSFPSKTAPSVVRLASLTTNQIFTRHATSQDSFDALDLNCDFGYNGINWSRKNSAHLSQNRNPDEDHDKHGRD